MSVLNKKGFCGHSGFPTVQLLEGLPAPFVRPFCVHHCRLPNVFVKNLWMLFASYSSTGGGGEGGVSVRPEVIVKTSQARADL